MLDVIHLGSGSLNTTGTSANNSEGRTAAHNLRNQIIKQVVPILELANRIDDSQVRLSLQAHCLDMVTGLEDVIDRYELGGLTGQFAE